MRVVSKRLLTLETTAKRSRRGCGVRHRDSDYGAQAAGLLLALCHSRACQQQALRDPRSILVGEW